MPRGRHPKDTSARGRALCGHPSTDQAALLRAVGARLCHVAMLPLAGAEGQKLLDHAFKSCLFKPQILKILTFKGPFQPKLFHDAMSGAALL